MVLNMIFAKLQQGHVERVTHPPVGKPAIIEDENYYYYVPGSKNLKHYIAE